ncbi:MFS transporter [Nordella sp. HKS 07]|uniref:MFS transporter n=1 Tax=Nordella sp. HKS 07 TaxID=2712222 RepID=UPI0013E1E499|nr:MFS transporter [Nordella sp. HKS 07]QIG47316.1 MFS transporter [Nordella sp. HKS 07]
MTTTDAPAKAGNREWIGLAVLALPCLIYSMDLTVLNLAVPQLSEELKPSASQLLWIIDIYGFFVAGSLIIMGNLGDRIGRRKLLMIGAAAFGIASIFAAFASNAVMLIAARAALGVAGATLAPSTLSLIRNMFHDPRERTTAIGVWVASFSVGGAIGPIFGGVLLEHFWWGSVFLVNVPIMILLLIAAPLLLPEFRDEAATPLDTASAAMSLIAVLALIYGLKQFAEYGMGWQPVLSVAIGIVVAFVFARRQKQLSHPLIDLSLFRKPAFSASLAVYMLGVLVAFGFFLFISQYLQLVLGMRPLEASLWMLPSGLSFILGSMLAPKIVRSFHPAYVMAGGLAIAGLACLMLTQIDTSHGLAILIVGFILMSLGLAPAFTLTTDLVVNAAPPERAGAAAAISETSAEFGGALGIAVLGSVMTALYRGAMSKVIPADMPQDAAEAVQGTLGGAIAVASELPADAAAVIVAAARTAFTDALVMTAVICTVIALAAALLAAFLLRRVEPAAHHA